MTKQEKVIKGMECCLPAHDPDCDLCPYDSIDLRCRAKLRDDIIALLKAQEPVSVQKKQMEMVGLQTWVWACGNCGQTVLFSANFCPWCGRAVKWE